MNRQEKYLEIRERLRNLKQVRASDDFMQRLHGKIAEIDTIEKPIHRKIHRNRIGILNIFSLLQNPWFIPATVVLIIAAVILYYTYLLNKPLENNQDLTSSKKIEQTDGTMSQQNLPEDKTSTVTPPLKNEEEKSNNKDITDALKKENKESSSNEREKQLTDRDIFKDNYEEPNVHTYKSDKEELANQVPDKDLILKRSEKPKEKVQSQDESNALKEGVITTKPNDITDSSKNKLKQKSLFDKINSIDKKSLENLREKIVK